MWLLGNRESFSCGRPNNALSGSLYVGIPLPDGVESSVEDHGILGYIIQLLVLSSQ